MTTILELLEELNSFVPTEQYFDAAKISSINSSSSSIFRKLLTDWGDGKYDNDPDIIVQSLVSLLDIN